MTSASRFRYLPRIIAALLLLMLIGVCFFIYQIRIHAPELNGDILKGQSVQQLNDSVYQYGQNWMRKNEYGVWEIYVKGSAMGRGFAYGRLATQLIRKQESYFVAQVERLVPSATYRWFLKWFVAWFNRDIDRYVPLEYQEEIFGVSQVADDSYDYIAPKYYRKLSYHAAHDIGHALKDMKMAGCTSFSVNNEFSADSALLIGRNFDFYMGEDFAREKIFMLMDPDSGYRFVSYAWPGFMGVVSGMNERGLTVTINAARSDIPTKAKMPIALLAREIVQYASNIKEAIAIAKKREVFVSESILIGSAVDGKSVLLEKSPQKFGVYESGSDFLVCSNHYQSDAYAGDSNNAQNIRGSDSQHRFLRMRELLSEKLPVDAQDAVSVLRDQRGAGGRDIGMGNSKTMNQLIAHHAIIFKPLDKLVWCSANPYQCGAFVAYDMREAFAAETVSVSARWVTPALVVPPDSFLLTEKYSNYVYYKEVKEKLFEAAFLGKPYRLTQAAEDSFLASNPMCYSVYVSLADYYNAQSNCSQAITYYESALLHDPASAEEVAAIREKIKSCK